jgi:hypothetical protein
LTQQQLSNGNRGNSNNGYNTSVGGDSPLFADMDAAAMLLETFTQAASKENSERSIPSPNNVYVNPSLSTTNGGSLSSTSSSTTTTSNNNSNSYTTGRRMSSVPGATGLTTQRERAAIENGYALSPRAKQDLYREDGSMERRWAVGSLIERLDEKIRGNESGGGDDVDGDDDLEENGESGGNGDDNGKSLEEMIERISTQNGSSDAGATKKRNRGRPRKNPLPGDDKVVTGSKNERIVKVDPVKPRSSSSSSEQVKERGSASSSSTKVTGGSLMTKRDGGNRSNKSTPSSSTTATVSKGSAKLVEPLFGANAIVKKQRRRVVKQLPKSRRDKNGNLMPSYMASGSSNGNSKGEEERVYTPGRGQSPDSLNLNRYYKTELLTAKEEYSLGMKVKFMVKCEAVHEGLSVEMGRSPSIAEWAAACGFDTPDAEMSSDNYVDTDLDRQIRPSGAESNNDLDPNMFVGNGLVNDTGVGRGRGRAKKPPPIKLGKFYDDSYEKFKRKSGDDEDDEALSMEENDEEDEVDIFLYRQKQNPGQHINQGSPRLFREMMLTAKEAKQRMVQCNMRLVVSIARRYHGVGVNVQDLVQEGSLGLARAAEKFDPKKGFKFSTYASW